MEERLSRIEVKIDRLEAGLAEVRGSVEELRRHMGVLHEEAMDRIKAIADPVPALERMLLRQSAEFHEQFVTRRELLEAMRHKRQ